MADYIYTLETRLAPDQQKAVTLVQEAAKVADNYVHDNPWQAVGVAAAIGFLLGLVVSRR